MMIHKFTALVRQGSIEAGCIQDQGGRDYQEDTVGFSDLPEGKPAERFSAIVADGMGGMASGAFVSDYTVKNLLAAEPGSPEEIFSAVARISGEIAAGGSQGGTTLAAVYVFPEGVYFCSVGDSRIYLCRDGILTQLTADQDYMSMLLDKVIDGKINWLQAKADPERDALAQFVGSGMQLSPDMNYIPLNIKSGDRLLICSDGVYNAISEEEMKQSLSLTAGGAAEDILGRVLARGYTNQDNFTAVVLQFMPGWNDAQGAAAGNPTGAEMHVDSAFYSGIGGAGENQDAFLCDNGIYAVADGLGGHKNGTKASAAAVRYFSTHAGGDVSPEGMNTLLEGANKAVRRSGGLSTAAVAAVREGEFTCGSVGDSRVYYFRNGVLTYQSRDHSVCQAAVELGQITREEIRSSEDRSGLIKALGSEPELGLRERCTPVDSRPGDAFLVCTDGFWQHVHESEMEADLIKSRTSAEWLRAMLKRLILASGDGGDNYTAVCGFVKPGALDEPKPGKKWLPLGLLIPMSVAAAGVVAAMIWLYSGIW